MAYTYEDVIPSLIPNTTMFMRLRDGVPTTYSISPVDGYVLHDNMGCWTEIDEMTGDETVKHAFYCGSCTCPVSYDFVANPREFYAVPGNTVPENQIFGGGGNNGHEIM